ncbi:MAG TPA: hypothetical protein VF199_03825 [Bacillales bacterium]
MKKQVMVIETNEADAQAGARALAQVEGTEIALLTPSPSYALQKIQENPPFLVVIDEQVNGWQGFCQKVTEIADGIKMVVTTVQQNDNLEQEAYGVGASAILVKPLSSIQEELPRLFEGSSQALSWPPEDHSFQNPVGQPRDSFERTPYGMERGHRSTYDPSWSQGQNPAQGWSLKQGVQRMSLDMTDHYGIPPRPRLMISVYSPKGGVGKTTMSLNLAVALRKISKRYLGEAKAFNVCLVDFDVDFGDVAASLQLTPRGSTVDWPKEENVHLDYVKSLFTFHPPSGIAILAGPERPELEFMLDEEQARRILTGTSDLFDIVVVDMGYSLRKSSLQAMSMATLPFFVTTPDTPAVRDMMRAKQSLESHNLNLQQAQLIMNKVPKKGHRPGTLEEVKRYIGWPVAGEVAEDPKVLDALSQGTPLMLNGKSSAAVEIDRMAETILKDYLPNDAARKPSFLKRLFTVTS